MSYKRRLYLDALEAMSFEKAGFREGVDFVIVEDQQLDTDWITEYLAYHDRSYAQEGIIQERFIEDFTVRSGIWGDIVKIGEVRMRRHTAIFPGSKEPSKVSFCNNCAATFVVDGFCVDCGMPQRFEN